MNPNENNDQFGQTPTSDSNEPSQAPSVKAEVQPTSPPDLATSSTAPQTEIQQPPVSSETQPTTEPQQPPVVTPIVAEPVVHGSKALALSSLILGIFGFLTGFLGIGILLGLIAVILGIISLANKRPSKGMAIAGIIVGALALLLGPIALSITFAAYNGIQQRALDQQAQSQLQSQSTTQYYSQ
jgi:hypothetical protein